MTTPRVTYCVDVGSVPAGNFGWARVTGVEGTLDHRTHEGRDAAAALRPSLREDCARQDLTVSIGFEAPLFLPLRDDPTKLGRARAPWEHSSFAGGLGASVLVTGLVQVAWALRDVGRTVTTSVGHRDDRGVLLVWEAFVSGRGTDELSRPTCPGGDHGPHACDALVGAIEAHRVLGGDRPAFGAVRETSRFAIDDGTGLDLVRAAVGEPPTVDDVAGWDAMVLQLPKPLHDGGP